MPNECHVVMQGNIEIGDYIRMANDSHVYMGRLSAADTGIRRKRNNAPFVDLDDS